MPWVGGPRPSFLGVLPLLLLACLLLLTHYVLTHVLTSSTRTWTRGSRSTRCSRGWGGETADRGAHSGRPRRSGPRRAARPSCRRRPSAKWRRSDAVLPPLLPLLLPLRLPCRRDRGTVGRGTLIVGAGGLADLGQGPIDGARHLGLTRRHSIELSACCFLVSCSFVVVKRHSVWRQFPPFREVCSYRSGNVGYNLVSRSSQLVQLSARRPPPPPRKRRLDRRRPHVRTHAPSRRSSRVRLRRPACEGHVRHDGGRHRRHGLPRLQLQGAPLPAHRLLLSERQTAHRAPQAALAPTQPPTHYVMAGEGRPHRAPDGPGVRWPPRPSCRGRGMRRCLTASNTRPVWPARAAPSGGLAEAGRSSGQPEACSGAERGLRSASRPKG